MIGSFQAVPLASSPSAEVIVLTMGDRPDRLRAAVESAAGWPTCVVFNGSPPVDVGADRVLVEQRNLGIPGGRNAAARTSTAEVLVFLDDDALLSDGALDSVAAAFAAEPWLGAVSMRLVDEVGETTRRHVPRLAARHLARSGDVTHFLGGASAIRRSAYEQVGGYFTDLFYGHEELELSWRLIDDRWRVWYLADVTVFHPRTEIARHPDGWRLTGRNRVWIARRTLPWPVALIHVAAWLVLGTARAPAGECRRSYVRGWMAGWRSAIEGRPIRWRTVWRLARLGRPPVI